MAEPKTRPTEVNPSDFIEKLTDEKRKKDAFVILDIMQNVTKEKPVMWGPSIIGFGVYKYKYDSGKEYEWPIAAFSPRKQNMVVYVMPGFEKYSALMQKLGKHKTGKSCLYINKLEDVDVRTLKEIIKSSYAYMKKIYK